jgi:Leucine Rich repeat
MDRWFGSNSTYSKIYMQVPDHSISALYPTDDTYILDENNLRSPKTLVDLCIDSLCRALPFLEGELPPGLPQDVVDDIVRSLMQHSALNAATLRVLRNCEIGVLNLAGCRGVSDAWFEPFSVKTPRSSPQLSHISTPAEAEMECMDLVNFSKKSDEESQDCSCSISSFVSASSTPATPTEAMTGPSNCVGSESPLTVDDFVFQNPSVTAFKSQPNATSSLFLLDLRGSQGLTDKGLMQLSNLGSLEVVKLDNCHSLVGRGLVAFASSHRLHTVSLANCRRLTDEAVINVSHLISIENLTLDGSRCLTDRSLAAISNLGDLQKLDLSQCDLMTDDGLEHLENLEVLEELSLGWCRMISDHGLNILTRHPGRSRLRVLRLARCPITDEGIGYVARLTSLTALDVNGCSNIGSVALGKTLEALPNLEHLDVSYCPGIL